MGSKWHQAKLGTYIDSCLGKMLDQNKNKGDYCKYLGNSNVRWGYFELDELSEMRFESHEHERYGIRKGDLIICEGGEPGRCAIWEDETPNMKIQKALHRVRTLEGLDSEYLYYWFLFAGRTGRLDAYFTGTTIKHLTGKALSELPIDIPPLSYQKYCAKILRSLDKKITLNRQINQTLEQMAQTLFKSWFVDFDPVIDNALDAGNDIPDSLQERAEQRRLLRAKADFKPLPVETRALFPSEFEETELGWVPKGWAVRPAEEIAEISIGKTPPRAETHWFSENSLQNIPWVSIKDMGTCGVFTNGSSEYLVPEGVDKFNVKLVPKDSIILSFKLTLGRVAITNERLTTNEAIAHFINPKFGLSKEFIYCYLMDFNFDLLGSTSSIATAVNSKIIKMMPFLVPKFDVTKHYTETVRNIFEKIKMTSDEINVLVQLRDSLLPKLISGELTLDDLPADIADAAEAL